jgi:hypothetical protein
LAVVDPVSAALSLTLLGVPMTAVRLTTCAIAAFAWFVGARMMIRWNHRDGSGSSAWGFFDLSPEPEKHVRALAFECIDRVGPGYVLGLLLAASVEAALPRGMFACVPAGVLVLGLVSLAAPLTLAPETLLPMLFMLTHKGLGTAGVAAASTAALLFSFATPTSLHVRGGIIRMGGFMLFAAASSVLAAGLANRFEIDVPRAHLLLSRTVRPIDCTCAIVVSGLLAASLLRIGPRAWWRAAFRIASIRSAARLIDDSCPAGAGH